MGLAQGRNPSKSTAQADGEDRKKREKQSFGKVSGSTVRVFPIPRDLTRHLEKEPISYVPSTRIHRITKSRFLVCSIRQSRSQAHFYLCTQRAISNRPECAFELLHYFFGGNRPSQTDQLALSPVLIQGSRLERPCTEGGISPMAPPTLTRRLQNLPPTHKYSISSHQLQFHRVPGGDNGDLMTLFKRD
jgi:hypothetical protein